MAEFCDGCPMRGNCIGLIDTFERINLISYHHQVGRVAVAVDYQGNSSQPFKQGTRTFENIEHALDLCEGVALESRLPMLNRLFGPKKHCPALGQLALGRSTDHYKLIAQDLNL
jgi:hypothetical protein